MRIKMKEPENRRGMGESARGWYRPEGLWKVNRHPVPAIGPFATRQSLTARAVTEETGEV